LTGTPLQRGGAKKKVGRCTPRESKRYFKGTGRKERSIVAYSDLGT